MGKKFNSEVASKSAITELHLQGPPASGTFDGTTVL
jgi:hypothetical protein